MMKGKVFQFKIPEGIMVLVPEAGKLFLVDEAMSDKIPKEVECEPIFQQDRGILTSTSLVLTENCNLRCVYCYEQSGVSKKRMSKDIIEASVDLITSNAKEQEIGIARMNLFGGEPTLAWGELVYAVDLFRKRCQNLDLDGRVTLITNGVVSPKKLDSVVDKLTFVSLSHDGLPEINDSQRPMAGNGSSTKIINKTAKFLLEKKGPQFFAIRTTVLAKNVKRLPEIHQYFSTEFPGVLIRYEPVFLSGRASQQGGIGISIREFGNSLLECFKTSPCNSLRNSFLTVESMAPGAFCSSCGINMHVLPGGEAVSCYRNDFKRNPEESTFFLGRYIPGRRAFKISGNKLFKLKRLHVDNIGSCKECFARYSCRGGCPAIKNSLGLDPWSDQFPGCEEIREVTVKFLRRQLLLQNEGQPM